MNQINQVLLEGNIVKAASKETEQGGFVETICVAARREYKNAVGEKSVEVSYFNCEAWGDFARKIQAKCTKGAGVRIVGRLKQERWKNDAGKSCAKVIVVVEHIEFAPKVEKTGETE